MVSWQIGIVNNTSWEKYERFVCRVLQCITYRPPLKIEKRRVVAFFYFVIIFLYCNTKDTTNKTRQTLLTIPLTISYLCYLLYNTSLEYNSYTTFTVCLFVCFFLFSITHLCTQRMDDEINDTPGTLITNSAAIFRCQYNTQTI